MSWNPNAPYPPPGNQGPMNPYPNQYGYSTPQAPYPPMPQMYPPNPLNPYVQQYPPPPTNFGPPPQPNFGPPQTNFGPPQYPTTYPPNQFPPQTQFPPQQGQYQTSSSQQGKLHPLTGRRKAVLIGINYLDNPTARLSGPITDVQNMRNLLMRYGFQNMLILTDDQQDPKFKPTRQNIMQAFRWLVDGSQPGDSLFLHYSGHGSQVVDLDGDEVDGYDETILPSDFKSAGQIVDDEIHDVLVKRVPFGCRLTAVMDCCHSGTGMDLPYIFAPKGRGDVPVDQITMIAKTLLGNLTKGKHQGKKTFWDSFGGVLASTLGAPPPSRPHGDSMGIPANTSCPGMIQEGSKFSLGDVLLFSGCRDDQTAADSAYPSHGGVKSGGAMTTAFIEAVNSNPNASYAQLIMSMREILQRRYSQVPQLSSGRPLDLQQPFSI